MTSSQLRSFSPTAWMRPKQEFQHPLLRLVDRDDRFAQTYRAFGRDLRSTLSPKTPVNRRRALARQLLQRIDELELGVDSSNAFRLEWLRLVAPELKDVVLQLAWGAAELEDAGFAVAPREWTRGGREFGDVTPPTLERRAGRSTGNAEPHLPVEVERVWSAGVGLVLSSVETDDHHNWELDECCAAVRLIALSAALETAPILLRKPQSRLNELQGTGLGLWEAVSHRVKSLGAARSVSPALWDGSAQRLLLLHLQGQVRADELKRGSGEAAPTVPLESEGEVRTHLVVTTPIPSGSSKEDREIIDSYQSLTRPVPLALLPTAERMGNIFSQLESEYPWAPNAIAELRQALETRSLLGVRALALPTVLLVGQPGTGKSRMVRRLSELLGLPYLPLALGGAGDGKVLTGTARGWSGGEPSALIKFVKMHNSASALVLLDELDKATHSTVNSPPITSVLLGLLEQETAKRWRDSYLQANCDLSRLSFWATANSLKGMSSALLSRFTVVYVPEPRQCDLPDLAKSMVADIAREWQLPSGVLPVPPPDIYVNCGNPRRLRTVILRYIHEWAFENLTAERVH